MNDTYTIRLNFLPVVGAIPPFEVFRRLRRSDETRPGGDVFEYSLPISGAGARELDRYWVSTAVAPGFEPCLIDADSNWNLTRKLLHRGLVQNASRALRNSDFSTPTNTFIDEISFVMRTHREGQEILLAQPYRLASTRQFGLLVDFHFRLGIDVPFSRRVQQLSLSLDKNFRRNLDYYVDRDQRVREFVQRHWGVISTISLPGGSTVRLDSEFVAIPATRLRPKTYVFLGSKTSRSQFSGLREFGPLSPVAYTPKLVFVFREVDRPAARRLVAALRGSAAGSRGPFPGFRTLFKTDIEIDSNPVVLPDLSETSMKAALQKVKEAQAGDNVVVPVVVLPDGEDNGYLAQKALFSHAEIPTQVCTLRVLQSDETLKWSIANLALQIFCKAGGQPWKVQPTPTKSLIVGISQSHRMKEVNGRLVVDRHFAFSVLTDNSGLFQEIRVLGEGQDSAHYMQDFRVALRNVLSTTSQGFDRVVVHTSFKLRHTEIDAVKQVVTDLSASSPVKFAVIKVNSKNRFFGVNSRVNSLVPFEGTQVKLGPHEYLVWFEGILPERTTVTKAFPGPTHLEFMRVRQGGHSPDEEAELLQDLVNLSGANWRGFNAKGVPVSVLYCQLVADLVQRFHDQNLPLPSVHDLRPWFL